MEFTIHNKKVEIKKIIYLILYYGFAQYLPESGKYFRIGGKIRYALCKRIFKKCGKYVNIERKAWFGTGTDIEIGDYSGIGINAHIYNNTIIGKHVMMGPNCFMLEKTHKFDSIDTPMMFQGFRTEYERDQVIIGDDVWIGREVMIIGSREIKKGSIIGARCVLTKSFPEYSIIGGNPSKLIRSRI